MKVTLCAALLTVLLLDAQATASGDRQPTSTDNAGVFSRNDLGCAGGTPVFGAMIGFGLLAQRRRRPA